MVTWYSLDAISSRILIYIPKTYRKCDRQVLIIYTLDLKPSKCYMSVYKQLDICTKKTHCKPSEQLFPNRQLLSYLNLTKI